MRPALQHAVSGGRMGWRTLPLGGPRRRHPPSNASQVGVGRGGGTQDQLECQRSPAWLPRVDGVGSRRRGEQTAWGADGVGSDSGWRPEASGTTSRLFSAKRGWSVGWMWPPRAAAATPALAHLSPVQLGKLRPRRGDSLSNKSPRSSSQALRVSGAPARSPLPW